MKEIKELTGAIPENDSLLGELKNLYYKDFSRLLPNHEESMS